MVEIILMNIENLADEDFFRFYSVLTEKRKKRIDRMVSPQQKVVSMYTELMIRYSAMKRLNTDFSQTQISYTEKGKPYIDNDNGFHFSVSHSGKVIALAISDCKIGIDIESCCSSDELIVKRFFAADEKAYYYNSENKCRAFTEIWTAKEAYIKLFGRTILDMKNTPSMLQTKNISVFYYDNSVISVCGEKIKNQSCKVKQADFNLFSQCLTELINPVPSE